ncbi:MAG: hypothetical protein WBA76_09350 [Phormidesmis sp.]
MITFVTFHIDLTGESAPPDMPETSSQLLGQGELGYGEMMSLMFQSVSVFHADARQVILTDQGSVFTHLPESVEIWRYEIDASNVMLSRSYAQLEFLKAHDFKSNVVFLDTDILLNGSLDLSLSWADFDVALTLRDDPKGMPINGGVMFVSKRRPQAAIIFFEAFYQRYIDSFLDQAQWWGDQKALVDIATHSGRDSLQIGEKKVGETLLYLLPCDSYNYSPDFKEEADIYGVSSHHKVMHFKGSRKQFMKPFWKSCISYKLHPESVQINVLQSQLNRMQSARQTLKKEREEAIRKYQTLLKKQNILEKQNASFKSKGITLEKLHRKTMMKKPFGPVSMRKWLSQQLSRLKFTGR